MMKQSNNRAYCGLLHQTQAITISTDPELQSSTICQIHTGTVRLNYSASIPSQQTLQWNQQQPHHISEQQNFHHVYWINNNFITFSKSINSLYLDMMRLLVLESWQGSFSWYWEFLLILDTWWWCDSREMMIFFIPERWWCCWFWRDDDVVDSGEMMTLLILERW